MDNVAFELDVVDFSGLFSTFSFVEKQYSVITGRTAWFRSVDSDNIILMPAGLRWSLDWDCSVKSSCCGVNTLSTSSIPAYMKLSSLATWYSIIHTYVQVQKVQIFRPWRAYWWDWHLPIRMCILMQWHLSKYGDVLKWHRSDHTCAAVAAAARHLQASRQMMPFIHQHWCSHYDDLFSVWEWFNGTLPTDIFSRLLVNEGMWHASSREHLQEWGVDMIMGTCTQQLNIYNIHHTIFNLDQ